MQELDRRVHADEPLSLPNLAQCGRAREEEEEEERRLPRTSSFARAALPRKSGSLVCEPFLWHFLFGICVLPEEFCSLLVRQRHMFMRQFSWLLDFLVFLRESGPGSEVDSQCGSRAARPGNLDIISGATVSCVPELFL